MHRERDYGRPIGADAEWRRIGEHFVGGKDFGLTWNAALETGGFLVGDEVRINLSIQAIAQ